MPRVNISISEDLKKYFEDLSKLTGASQSSLMAIYLAEYVDIKKRLSIDISNELDKHKF